MVAGRKHENIQDLKRTLPLALASAAKAASLAC
jgi:hypothetical protein